MPDTWGIVYAGPSLGANLAENWQEGTLECDHGQEPHQRTDALFDFIAALRALARDTIFFDGLNSSVLSAKVRCTREDFRRMEEHFILRKIMSRVRLHSSLRAGEADDARDRLRKYLIQQ